MHPGVVATSVSVCLRSILELMQQAENGLGMAVQQRCPMNSDFGKSLPGLQFGKRE